MGLREIGTRFCHLPCEDTPSDYRVIIPDFYRDSTFTQLIPKEYGLIEQKREPFQARRLFVKLLNDLVNRVKACDKENVIPYVWGGSSFIWPHEQDDFYLNEGGKAWERKGKHAFYTGYDCSELIMRHAQIAGIDFPWKISTLMKTSLKPLEPGDILENGDLIWTPGHVVVVSNKDRNELIQARSYSSGYGSVTKTCVSEHFADIKDLEELISLYHNGQKIQLKNRAGETVGQPLEIALLKLF